MKFDTLVYKRPVLAEFEKEFIAALNEFDQAQDFVSQNKAMELLNHLRKELDTAMNIAYIRHTIDTEDKFYGEEQKYFDHNAPLYTSLVHRYYRSLTQAKFQQQLKEKWGRQLFTLAEITLNTFSDDVIELLQKENLLNSQYTKLVASAEIFFEGEERNLSGLGPFLQSLDRKVRKMAFEAYWGFLKNNTEEFDRLYDKLVHVRHEIAQKLGYKNFVELGYARMHRSDYNADMVKIFRDQVRDHIVPIATKLIQRQQRRLKLDKITYYDESLNFNSGNATPKGPPSWIVANAQKMYRELSPETDQFFNVMLENNLMDLENKKGKAVGGYCSVIAKYGLPFIFSNFNGTSGDVDVLTHEAGHAFQCYQSRDFGIPEYFFPTAEACEIHSMSMEFFAWPWMENFFKEDVEKYKFQHLSGAILFLPYGVTVDEFQHYVYENPQATPAERKQEWRRLEKIYMPHRNYEENSYLEQGGFWQKQGHIFSTPFYYIDYTLAQICAFQFWLKAQKDQSSAFNDYLKLCKAGGSLPFLELVKMANLRSPFAAGTLESIVGEIEDALNQIDDQKF